MAMGHTKRLRHGDESDLRGDESRTDVLEANFTAEAVCIPQQAISDSRSIEHAYLSCARAVYQGWGRAWERAVWSARSARGMQI
eukprot:5166689-Pyramimonas_sp.AAC.1